MTLFWNSVSKICKLPSNASSLITVQTPTNALPLSAFTLTYNRTDMISQEFYSKNCHIFAHTALYQTLHSQHHNFAQNFNLASYWYLGLQVNHGSPGTTKLCTMAWRCFGKIDTKIVTLTDSLLTCTFNTVFVAFDMRSCKVLVVMK